MPRMRVGACDRKRFRGMGGRDVAHEGLLAGEVAAGPIVDNDSHGKAARPGAVRRRAICTPLPRSDATARLVRYAVPTLPVNVDWKRFSPTLWKRGLGVRHDAPRGH